MSEARTYKPTKLVLYQVVPKIIKAYRLPMSDGTPGRRAGDATADEIAGASDVLYHLMCTDSIAWMAKRLGVSRQRMYDTLGLALHACDERGDFSPPPTNTEGMK